MLLRNDEKSSYNPKDYGILIPINSSRGEKALSFLKDCGKANFFQILDFVEGLNLIGEKDLGKELIGRKDLELAHDSKYVADLFSEKCEKAILETYELITKDGQYHRYEPASAIRPLEDFFQPLLNQVKGTYIGARLVLSGLNSDGTAKFCYYFGGGKHHSRYSNGAGFCLLNDIIVVARKLQVENGVGLIWIIDVDAHKGCGTAELVHFLRNKEIIGTSGCGVDILNLSIHMKHGWPLDEETLKDAVPGRAPLIPADVEILIDVGEEGNYVPELKKGISRLEELSLESHKKCNFPHGRKPDLVIVVDGSDPYEKDGLPSSGLLRLTLEQCLARDRTIYDYVKENNIPSIWVMAGGYGEYAWEPIGNFLKSLVE
jgi:acetoin utilization deacetylase AcuC-like enzyme